jgi:hypothetical protein
MAWQMEVKVRVDEGPRIWAAVRPTGGSPYRYNTRLEAYRMLEMCYPEEAYGSEVRIVEVA